MLDKEKGKNFPRPDSMKSMMLLAIPVGVIAFLLSGPSLFPIGSSSTILVVPQIVLGVFLAIVTTPFTIVATVFRAFGIDLFYTTGIAAKAGISIAAIATVFWWYALACLVASIYRRIKRGPS